MESEELEHGFPIITRFTATFQNSRDRQTYKKLIWRLVNHFKNLENRREMNIVEITEKKKGGIRVSYVNAKTLYIISVKIDINIQNNHDKPMNGYFIFTNQQDYRENYINIRVPIRHAANHNHRVFWSPWFLFFEHNHLNENALPLYRSLIVTISEAIRFETIKNDVAEQFHIVGGHNWEETWEFLINNWKRLSRQNDPRVTIRCIIEEP